jgi:hypothetical protein
MFSPKNLVKIFAQTNASFCKNMIVTLVFEKNANLLQEKERERNKIDQLLQKNMPTRCCICFAIECSIRHKSKNNLCKQIL